MKRMSSAVSSGGSRRRMKPYITIEEWDESEVYIVHYPTASGSGAFIIKDFDAARSEMARHT